MSITQASRARAWVQLWRGLFLVLLATGNCKADLHEHERRLTEVDAKYLALEEHRPSGRREKCAGIEQLATLKGEWVRKGSFGTDHPYDCTHVPKMPDPGVSMCDLSCELSQVKHPDHSYQGMTDHKNCPSFVNEFDCHSSGVDAQYHSLQQKVVTINRLKTPDCKRVVWLSLILMVVF